MAAILYFVEQDSPSDGFSAGDAKKAGLDYALACGFSRVKSFIGPGEKGGVLLLPAWAEGVIRPQFDAESQKWRKINETAWLTLVGGNEVEPDKIMRPECLAGHEVVLGDGQSWTIPVARRIDGVCGLPARLSLKEGSWVSTDPTGAYKALWDAACRVWDALMVEIDAGTNDLTIDVTAEAAVAVEALSVNYRLSEIEVDMLGLLTTASVSAILRALIDWPRVEAAMDDQKKTSGHETLSSEPGERVES